MPHQFRHRVSSARTARPYTLACSLVLILPGVLAIIYGDAVSQALTNISAGVLSRIIGAALLLGSVVTLVGLLLGRHLYEAFGLTLMSAALAIYGLGVMLGLGLGGMVAGPVALSLSLGMLLRIISLSMVAREISNVSDR